MDPAGLERGLERGFGRRFVRSLRACASDNASAYGYSVVITAAFGILNATARSPGNLEVFAFAGGAVVAFGLVEAVASGGFRHRLEEEPSQVRALGSSLAFLSVGLALAVVLAVGKLVGGLAAWPLGSFLSTLAYLAFVALEMDLAKRLMPGLPRGRTEK